MFTPAMHCTIALFCRALHYNAPPFTALYCTALHCTEQVFTPALHNSSILQCTTLQRTNLHCTALHCTTLHCELNCTTHMNKDYYACDAGCLDPLMKHQRMYDNMVISSDQGCAICSDMTVIVTLNGPIFQAISEDIGRYRTISGDIGRYRTISGDIQQY